MQAQAWHHEERGMSAIILILLGLVFLVVDAADLTITGLGVIGAILIAAGLILAGALKHEFWFPGDSEETDR